MSTTQELLALLADSGIVPAEQLRAFRERLRRENGEKSREAVTRDLVLAGLLTEFQASEIESGNAGRLVFGSYVLLDRVGRGGMGEVYRARHTLMNREVAVKLLRPSMADKIGSVQRFRREVRAAAKLAHPNIVTALDAGDGHGLYYLVMEFVRGTNVAEHVSRGGPLTVAAAIDLTLDVAAGLAYAHAQGVLHRDVKPANLVLTEEGKVKILDLGLSQLRVSPEANGAAPATEAQLTEFGQLMGTVDFMAPEQALDPHRVDERADIYSLGCTLYFLLTGIPPFPGESIVERLLSHRDGEIPSIRETRPEVPPRVEALVRQMLAKLPNQRMAAMDDVVRELQWCRRELDDPEAAGQETVHFRIEPNPTRRGPLRVVVLALVAASLVGAAAYWKPWDRGAGTAAGVAATPGPPQLTRPADLLKQVDLTRDAILGTDWSWDGSRLLTATASPSILEFAYPVPDEYGLRMTAARRTGEGPLVIGLVVGGHQCYVLLDADRGEQGYLYALGVNQQGGLVVLSHGDRRFEPNRPCAVRCVVRSGLPADIEVEVDGEPVVEWSGDPADLKLGAGWDRPQEGRLFLGTNNGSGFSVSELVIEPLPDRAR